MARKNVLFTRLVGQQMGPTDGRINLLLFLSGSRTSCYYIVCEVEGPLLVGSGSTLAGVTQYVRSVGVSSAQVQPGFAIHLPQSLMDHSLTLAFHRHTWNLRYP